MGLTGGQVPAKEARWNRHAAYREERIASRGVDKIFSGAFAGGSWRLYGRLNSFLKDVSDWAFADASRLRTSGT